MYSRLVRCFAKQPALSELFARCLFCLVILIAAPSAAVEVIDLNLQSEPVRLGDYVELLVDKDHRYSIDDVVLPEVASQFFPITQDQLNFGFTTNDYWIRFSIKSNVRDDWLLEVAYPLLDIIEFYVPRPNGGYLIKRTGDTLLFSTREVTHNNFVFNIPKDAHNAQVYYLHIESEGSTQAPLVLWPEKDFNQHVLHQRIGYGVYYGIIFVMGLYNLFLFLFVRDRNYLYYVIYIATYGTMQLGLNGLAFEYLWPNSPWWASIAHMVLVGFSAISIFLFTRSFLNTKENAPRLDKLIFYLMLATCTAIIGTVFINFNMGAKALTLLSFALAVVIMITGMTIWLRGYRPARYFMLAWLGFLLGIVINALLYVGVLPNNIFTGYAMQAGSVLEAVLFSLAIADRLLLLQQEKHQAEKIARQHLTDLNEELELRVEARTADLVKEKEKVEMANTQLEKMNEKLAQLASMDALTDLVNHRTFIERLTTELSEAYRYKYSLAVIMIDLDYFKKINDKYGHQIGDEVLIRVASILKDALRLSDVGARYGGEEFVLMLPHGTMRTALQTAERIRKGVASTSVPGKLEIKLTASLGVACTNLNEPEMDYRHLIRMADAALHHAKLEGRNRVCEYRPDYAW